MKKIFFLLSLFLLTSCSYSQNTEQVYIDKNNETSAKASETDNYKIDFVYNTDTNTNSYVRYEPCFISVNYPKTSYSKLNQELDFWAKQKINDFYKNYNSEKSELKIEFQKYKMKDKLESIKFDIFKTDGLERELTVETKTIDEKGNFFYFKNETDPQKKCLESLSHIIRTYIADNNLENSTFDSAKFLKAFEPLPENYNNFTIDEQNVVFYFDESLIGKTTTGIALQIPIPTKDIYEICKDAYPEIADLKEYTDVGNSKPEKTIEENVTNEIDTNILENNYDSSKKYIALTFDDGPHAVYTAKLIDELEKLDVRVTFFLLGQKVYNNQDIVKKMYENKHEIGNHSYSHPDLRKMTFEEITQQIEDTNNIIFDITKQKPKSLRTPYGIVNDGIKGITRDTDMNIILWDVDPKDWQTKNPNSIKDHILANTHNGDIILLHDIYETSVDGAIMAIKELKNQGYEFLTVTELLSLKGTLKAGDVYYSAKLD